MKRYGNLYTSMCNFDNLLRAARKAEKGKRFRSSCRNFNLDLEKHLLSLQKELKDKIYRPGPYHHFKIYEPKERIISAAPYRDRVVHYLLRLNLVVNIPVRDESLSPVICSLIKDRILLELSIVEPQDAGYFADSMLLAKIDGGLP